MDPVVCEIWKSYMLSIVIFVQIDRLQIYHTYGTIRGLIDRVRIRAIFGNEWLGRE